MGPGDDGQRDLGQMQVHGGGVALGQDQGAADATRRTDGTEDIGRAGALVAGCRGARSPFRPPPRDLVLLADPGLVLPPELYGCAPASGNDPQSARGHLTQRVDFPSVW